MTALHRQKISETYPKEVHNNYIICNYTSLENGASPRSLLHFISVAFDKNYRQKSKEWKSDYIPVYYNKLLTYYIKTVEMSKTVTKLNGTCIFVFSSTSTTNINA